MEKKLLRKVVLRMLKRQSREVRASLRVWAARVVLTVALLLSERKGRCVAVGKADR
jgi:hypothetical protein